jgi:hypothetical protein
MAAELMSHRAIAFCHSEYSASEAPITRRTSIAPSPEIPREVSKIAAWRTHSRKYSSLQSGNSLIHKHKS